MLYTHWITFIFPSTLLKTIAWFQVSMDSYFFPSQSIPNVIKYDCTYVDEVMQQCLHHSKLYSSRVKHSICLYLTKNIVRFNPSDIFAQPISFTTLSLKKYIFKMQAFCNTYIDIALNNFNKETDLYLNCLVTHCGYK